MSNKWRIPTIMELSQLCHSQEVNHFSKLLSCTQQSDYHWIAYWSTTKESFSYVITAETEEMVCIFVKIQNGALVWSRAYGISSYLTALKVCESLPKGTKIVYKCPRAEVFNE